MAKVGKSILVMLFFMISLGIMSGCAKDKQEAKLEEPSNQTAITNVVTPKGDKTK